MPDTAYAPPAAPAQYPQPAPPLPIVVSDSAAFTCTTSDAAVTRVEVRDSEL